MSKGKKNGAKSAGRYASSVLDAYANPLKHYAEARIAGGMTNNAPQGIERKTANLTQSMHNPANPYRNKKTGVDVGSGIGATGGYGGGYTSNPYEAQANALFEQLMNRGDFRYDLQGDMLYRQYADQYSQMGKTAMRDAMGTAAGLTGGYGSSYAQQVGSQAYQQYLGQLNGMIPEFYDRAYNAWLNEGDDLRSRYELALQMAAANGGGGGGGGGYGSAAATGEFTPTSAAFTDYMATKDPAALKDALQLAGGMSITGMDDYLAGAGGEAKNLQQMKAYMEQLRRMMTTK